MQSLFEPSIIRCRRSQQEIRIASLGVWLEIDLRARSDTTCLELVSSVFKLRRNY